jgi:N-sulfoglucosamine sulfohydrolase
VNAKLSDRLNIVYLHSHDTGRYVQPYGYPVQTPNIQRLAEQGVLFRQAFSAAPTCSPARAALLTGQAPHSAGMLGLAHRGFQLSDPSRHIARVLRDAGYRTILAGSQHVTSGDPSKLGYELVNDLPDAEVVTVAAAADTVESLAGDSSDRPFFLDIGFSQTHRPFPQLDPAENRYVMPIETLPNSPETRFDTACFVASVRDLDCGVGTVIDALDRSDLSDRTLVLLTTDHGPAFPRMKANLNDQGIGVMLIMRGPNEMTGGRVVDALVSQIDLFPTICDLTGIETPAWLQGVSLMPLISQTESAVRAWHFSEVTFHAAYEPQRAIRSPRWTYIRRFGESRFPVLANCDDGPSKEYLLRHGWQLQQLDEEQLFDNSLDPMQQNNLVGGASHAEVQELLAHKLLDWMADTDDPLLQGEVPLPPGAVVNDPESRSPMDELITQGAGEKPSRVSNPEVRD